MFQLFKLINADYGPLVHCALNMSGDHDDIILRPSVPPPTASSIEVQNYFVQFLRAFNHRLTLEEAGQIADKLHADGTGLYELSEQQLVDQFGFEGQSIYQALRRSKWGFVSLSFKSNLKRSLLILIYSIGQLYLT